ncbi:BnaCnng35250D [Brassica napus]|uniref:BnaCnng35250D protein n=1 Tax=Brassica napus TaxID=3708 RepID=A0A078J887_BRANA|nr:BnaCnng35250D [Brassica napus]
MVFLFIQICMLNKILRSVGGLKMDLPELLPRMFTLGEEPTAIRSISYHSDFLKADEYEDLKASKLGVFIKFKELGFGWTSRLVHFILCFQLYIKKKFELWSLVVLQPVRCEVTKEMGSFWEKMGVDLNTGPRKKFSTATPDSLARLVMDLEKFENYPWGRVAFKVLMDSLKAKDLTQTGYTVDGFIQVLQVWAYYAMPELGAIYGSPVPDRPSPLLLAYKGGQGRRRWFKSAINRHINVNNFVQKDLDEMFPEWDGDVEDPAADNIIKIERDFKDISDAISDGFGTCLREIKLLGDRMGAVEKMITKKGSSSDDLQLTKPVHEPGSESVNGAKAGQNEAKEHSVTTEPSSSTELCLVKPADDLPSDEPSILILDKQVSTASDLLLEEARRQTKKETAMVNLREKSERERKLAPTQQTSFKGNIIAKKIIPNKKVG